MTPDDYTLDDDMLLYCKVAIDALQNNKKTLERTMLAEAWSLPLCQQAYMLIDRQVMTIYAELHPYPKDIPPPVTPTQHLAD